MTDTAPKRDYSETLFLPQTEFPMRAGLPQREPEILARWNKINLYKRLRETAAGRPRFVLHDGPPYANGNIHIGHALNKVLKDLVTRSQQMLGFDSNYVPGWDCHGLPIEWKIEEQYRAKGKNKDEVPVIEFRKECRTFAEHWLSVQREEFKRLGITGDWDHPYSTTAYHAEAQIAREIMKFKDNGLLYRGSKPVMWSVVEKTALAEAEIEYQDYQSDMVWVKFPVRIFDTSPFNEFDGNGRTEEDVEPFRYLYNAIKKSSIVIWTTTPWTLPGNRAISYSHKIDYGIYEVTANERDFGPRVGELYIVSKKLADTVTSSAKISLKFLQDIPNKYLDKIVCSHPLASLSLRERVAAEQTGEGLVPAASSASPSSVASGDTFSQKGEGNYMFPIPLLDGDHVTDDVGTGFVHTAPSHGREDFEIWMQEKSFLEQRGIDTRIPFTIDDDSVYTKEAPGFEGKRVITEKGDKGDANEAVIKALIDNNALVARGRLKHQYPHSWRSKKPVIFRNTPQWFIAMDRAFEVDASLSLRERVAAEQTGEGLMPAASSTSPSSVASGDTFSHREKENALTLRQTAFNAIKQTEWVPATGENRITGMIENKPDWVMSRQRAWGVPITVFVHKETKELLRDAKVDEAIAGAFETDGGDAWFADGAKERFLTPFGHNPDHYDMVMDVLDVWFDSGSTHSYVLNTPKHFPGLANIHRVVDGGQDRVMYLEGSDQHRGWFQSSLLESCGTRGRAPFDVVLTHGFCLDEKGQKMSKSLGNVTAPQDIIKDSGADILRLWVAAADYSDDLRIGPEILKTFVETYRKLRNTLRWMLGTLAHYDTAHSVKPADMPELERLMLHRLAELAPIIGKAYETYDYRKVITELSAFLNTELSAFYFDIRKDTLYCDKKSSFDRHASLTCIEQIFRSVTLWLAPILVFTAEEAWLSRYPEAESVHLENFPHIPSEWKNEELAEKWEKVRKVRRVVTGAIEVERAAKRIGSSLEAQPVVYISDVQLLEAVESVKFDDVCITSGIVYGTDDDPVNAFRLPELGQVSVIVKKASGIKCARSWRYFDPATADPAFPDITPRDAQAMREWEKRHA
jgi:isoleucyl-tRNA synthetase